MAILIKTDPKDWNIVRAYKQNQPYPMTYYPNNPVCEEIEYRLAFSVFYDVKNKTRQYIEWISNFSINFWLYSQKTQKIRHENIKMPGILQKYPSSSVPRFITKGYIAAQRLKTQEYDLYRKLDFEEFDKEIQKLCRNNSHLFQKIQESWQYQYIKISCEQREKYKKIREYMVFENNKPEHNKNF